MIPKMSPWHHIFKKPRFQSLITELKVGFDLTQDETWVTGYCEEELQRFCLLFWPIKMVSCRAMERSWQYSMAFALACASWGNRTICGSLGKAKIFDL